jgi:anti-sigma regulatory factor (Ser/Thr protein kinase)
MPEWTLPAETRSVGRARRLTAGALVNESASARERVTLVVSELVTNCIRHAGTELALKLTHRNDTVLVEVTDFGSGRPRLLDPAPAEPHGRGLMLVEALSGQWGVTNNADRSKTVWCTIALAAS